MGYRENVCIVVSKSGWKKIVQYVQSMNDDNRSLIINFFKSADRNETLNGDHLLVFDSIKTYADDSKLFFDNALAELDLNEYHIISVGEDNNIQQSGDYHYNSFDSHIVVEINIPNDGEVFSDFEEFDSKQSEIIETINNTAIIDDHVCINCGNTKCSKHEKSCWKCGQSIKENK